MCSSDLVEQCEPPMGWRERSHGESGSVLPSVVRAGIRAPGLQEHLFFGGGEPVRGDLAGFAESLSDPISSGGTMPSSLPTGMVACVILHAEEGPGARLEEGGHRGPDADAPAVRAARLPLRLR